MVILMVVLMMTFYLRNVSQMGLDSANFYTDREMDALTLRY